jgi:hypothetical protein
MPSQVMRRFIFLVSIAVAATLPALVAALFAVHWRRATRIIKTAFWSGGGER